METLGTIAQLWRYPVKSFQGEQVEALEIAPGGAIGDRTLAVVDPAAGKVLAKALYRAAFGEGRDIAAATAVADIAVEQGHDREEVQEALQNPRVKDLLKGEIDAAIRKGVFGSPYMIADGEPFWGFDRLDDLGVWLDCGGW